jgi:hypothetical protein
VIAQASKTFYCEETVWLKVKEIFKNLEPLSKVKVERLLLGEGRPDQETQKN